MVSKAELLTIICDEFAAAQKGEAEPWIPPKDTLSLPPVLPVGNGKHLDATDTLLRAVRKYALLLRENSSSIRSSYSLKEFSGLVRLAFGQTLDALGVVEPKPQAVGPAVEAVIEAEIESKNADVSLIVGCWLVEDQAAYPIKIGPVTFQTRGEWLEEQANAGKLSKIASRRLRRAWSGNRLRPRVPSFDEDRENAIAEAVQGCPVVCEIETSGMSPDLVLTKGLLAARLAITALALLWGNSKNALEHMRLIYDGEPYRRRYATTYKSGGFGSGSSWVNRASGQYSREPLKPLITGFQPTLELVGAAIGAYVKPHVPVSRTKIYNALFLSLWWFHEGCREESDHMAVTAFAASLDALAAGRKASGIKRLIEARLGFKPSDSLMKDGSTVNAVIDRVYDAARSRFIHGSSTDFIEDWSELRGTAEAVSRLLLVQLTFWLHKNPTIDEVKSLQVK